LASDKLKKIINNSVQMKSKSYISNGNGSVILKELDMPSLKSSEVLVKINSFGLNRVDILQAKGLYLPPQGSSEVLGLEFSGEVIQIENVNSKFKIGDRVCGLTSAGAFSEYINISESLLIKLPDNLSFAQGAAISEAWITAYFNLCYLNKITSKDLVLIHSAAGGVGIAAIQISLAAKAQVLASVGSNEKVKYLKDNFNVQVYNYKDGAYQNLLKEHKSKVTFVLDTVGPSILNLHSQLMSYGGKIQNIGLLGGASGLIEMADFIKKNLSLSSSTLRSQDILIKAELCQKIVDEIMPYLESGKYKIPIFKVFSANQIDVGFKSMISNEIIGKIVYSWDF
jgi:NADPH:quinone reductase-like Zn-dependent oxidoreductase